MSSRTYVLESRWTWDHSNTEYFTITVEDEAGWKEFETLGDPDRDQKTKVWLKDKFKRMAEEQSGCLLGPPMLVRLYKVIDALRVMEGKHDGAIVNLNLRIQPICNFDREGNPVPLTIVGS